MKLRDVHAYHVTGNAKVIKNNLFDDVLAERRIKRSLTETFFKPYESKKEVIFCARNTIAPVANIALFLFNPEILVLFPAFTLIFSGASLVLSAVAGLVDDKIAAEFFLNYAESILANFFQKIVNLLVLPVAALIMLTRGISTVLQKTNIYDFDAPQQRVRVSNFKTLDEDINDEVNASVNRELSLS